MKPSDANRYKWPSWALLVLVLAGPVLGASSTALGESRNQGPTTQEPSRKLSRELENFSKADSVDVIVQYRVRPSDAHYGRITARGGSLSTDLRGMKAGAFHVPTKALIELSNDPDVTYISEDRTIRATLYSNNPDFYESAVLAQSAWNQYDGSGIGIAVIDSGITNNGDFDNRIVYSQSFVRRQWWLTNDPYGHGTHVAGILAGNGSNSTGSYYTKTFIGVANNANLINLRVLDQDGKGSASGVIAAIQTAIQLKNQYNIRIINLSLGGGVWESYTQDPLCQAVEAAWQAGIVVVVAAGNEGRDNDAYTSGYGTINSPGNDPLAITVGAMKPMGTPGRGDDLIASYSSKGPTLFDEVVKPDIVAPGNQVISVLSSNYATLFNWTDSIPNYYYDYGNGSPSSNYFTLSGTSMATPVVAGAAALMLEQNPAMTPDQVKARLMKTAYKIFPRNSTATDSNTGQTYNSQYDVFTVGAGYLDIQNALQNTDLVPAGVGSAASPTVALDPGGSVYIVNGPSILSGSSVLWGTKVVFGQSVLWGTRQTGESLLWGSGAVSGSSVLWGDSVLWGSSVLWGDSSPEAESIQTVGEQ